MWWLSLWVEVPRSTHVMMRDAHPDFLLVAGKIAYSHLQAWLPLLRFVVSTQGDAVARKLTQIPPFGEGEFRAIFPEGPVSSRERRLEDHRRVKLRGARESFGFRSLP